MKKFTGFTLIELILVAGIFGLIASGMIAVMNPAEQFRKANDSRRKSDLATIQRALEAYYQDNGSYPNNSSNYRIRSGSTTIEYGSSWQPYINVLPKDPLVSQNYVYQSRNNGQSYVMYAALERSSDPESCNNGSVCANMNTYSIPANSCGNTCNYGVTSSDLRP